MNPVPARHRQEIGSITVNFALLEHMIEFSIWELITKDQFVGQIITAELSFRNRIALLSSLVRHLKEDSETISELETLLSRALQAEEKRNLITHSDWAAGKTRGTITRFKRTAKISKGLRHQSEETTIADLKRIAKRNRNGRFGNKVGDEKTERNPKQTTQDDALLYRSY